MRRKSSAEMASTPPVPRSSDSLMHLRASRKGARRSRSIGPRPDSAALATLTVRPGEVGTARERCTPTRGSLSASTLCSLFHETRDGETVAPGWRRWTLQTCRARLTSGRGGCAITRHTSSGTPSRRYWTMSVTRRLGGLLSRAGRSNGRGGNNSRERTKKRERNNGATTAGRRCALFGRPTASRARDPWDRWRGARPSRRRRRWPGAARARRPAPPPCRPRGWTPGSRPTRRAPVAASCAPWRWRASVAAPAAEHTHTHTRTNTQRNRSVG